MNKPLFALAIAFGIIVAILFIRRFYLFASLRRIRFGKPSSEEVSLEQVPPEIRLILDEAAKILVELGFEAVGCRAVTYSSKNRGVIYHRYYLHRESSTFADVLTADNPEPGAIATITFDTWLGDGNVIATANRRRHLLLPGPSRVLLDDGYLESTAEQWEFHQKRLAQITIDRVTDYDQMVRSNEALGEEMIAAWSSHGFTRPAGENEWRLTIRGALKYMSRLFAGYKRAARLPPIHATVSMEARISADMLAYQAHEAINSRGLFSRSGKVLLFVISAILGVVAFGLAFSWQIVPVLLGIILFHEFGHALAMRATGYRNVQVLVVPMLGAVASGRKDDVSPWAKLMVLLAGPLPGLIISIIILHAIANDTASHPLLLQIGLMSLVINLFKMLPFTPLDGGQIIETFLFARWPRLRFTFFIASCAAIVAVGLWLDSIALVVFALWLMIASRRFKHIYHLARRIGPTDKDTAPRKILTALHEEYATTVRSFTQRILAVRSLLPLVIARPLSGMESISGVAIYMAVIALPIFSLSGIPVARQAFAHIFHIQSSTAETKRDWDAEVAKANTADERWKILMEAARWEEDENEEIETANRRYQQAMAVARQFPSGDIRVLDTRIALARSTTDNNEALTLYREVLDEASRLHGNKRLRVAEILEAIYWRDADLPEEKKLGYLRDAVAVRESIEQTSFELGFDHKEMARILYKQGDKRNAEVHLRQGLAASNHAYQALPLIWMLIDQNKLAEAEALARQSLPQKSDHYAVELQDTLAWSQLLQGQKEAAYQQLATLINADKSKRGWEKYYLMLDIIHFSEGDPKMEDHWREQLKSEILKENIGKDAIETALHSAGDYSPWESLRTKTRALILDGLELPQVSTKKICS